MAEELARDRGIREGSPLPPPEEIIRGEENVLVLDTAEWRTDGDPWESAEDMLRIGLKAKEKHGISTAAASGAQPWALPPEKPPAFSCRGRSRSEKRSGSGCPA